MRIAIEQRGENYLKVNHKKNDHLYNVSKIVKDLMNKHKETQEKLAILKE